MPDPLHRNANSAHRPPVLIEHWLPVQELGIESRRERAASSALPPLYFLHVWWARRPLTVSRAAILAALLPPDTDHGYFLRTLGILKDPVEAFQRLQQARQTGNRLEGEAYGYKRAFTYTPDEGRLRELRQTLARHWGREKLVFLDPMAGGGSIPFEALRYGLDTWANELNPVACVILKATLEYPAIFGPSLAEEIGRAARQVHERAQHDLEPFFPMLPGEEVYDYLWAHTIKCPGCGLVLPLSPNWWLERAERRIATRPFVQGQAVHFEIVEAPWPEGFDPDEGTIARGKATCPGCPGREVIPQAEIKRQAQSGEMGYQLVALVIKREGKREYRLPGKRDLEAVAEAERYLREHWAELDAAGLIPPEPFPTDACDDRPIQYGMPFWRDMFTPRQLLSHVVHLQHLREVGREWAADWHADRDPAAHHKWQAVMTYLTLMLDKCLDYNSRMARWENTRGVVKGTFDRHDFAFLWSFGEMNPVPDRYGGWEWSMGQVLDAYRDLAKLAAPYRLLHQPETPIAQASPRGAGFQPATPHTAGFQGEGRQGCLPHAEGCPPDANGDLHITCGNAATWRALPDGEVDIIVVDPPYYDNVMYAECSDFFYVWQKRALGEVFPELFATPLTDKQQEAVANLAQFRDRKAARVLAAADYEHKMRAFFRRMQSVLRPDGVMVVMFTHKQTEAWDALAGALIEGGWEITSSWPVHTESEHSLHQAKKNAAQSTILLTCRRRAADNAGGWWNQVRGEITRTVKERVQEYEALGIRGVDLMLAAFGPALQVICKHWPVRLPTGEPITPQYALDLARETVQAHRWVALVGSRPVEVDRPTQFVIYAWDFYKAEQIRFDEARRLYLGLGVEEKELKSRGLVSKAGAYLILLSPAARLRKGGFDPEATTFATTIDALHAAIWWYGEGGLTAVRRFLERTGLGKESQFLAGLQAYLRALPAVREEFKALREIADALLRDKVEVPADTGQLALGM